MSKHVHSEIIKAWGEGKTIEVFDERIGSWNTDNKPYFSPYLKYRVVEDTLNDASFTGIAASISFEPQTTTRLSGNIINGTNSPTESIATNGIASYINDWETMNNHIRNSSITVNSTPFANSIYSLEEICTHSINKHKNTVTVYENVKLIKFKNDYHVGADDKLVNNVKYTFDATTHKLISVEMI